MHSTVRKKVIISVTSDLVTDQRVNRAALTLFNSGLDVILVGRKIKNSLPLEERIYQTKRFKLWFEKGPLFYASYNLRLFFYLLFSKADVYFANDLDTLLANYLAAKIKNVRLVYDSHEYFTEVPELIRNPFKKAIWLSIERWIFPKLYSVMTVNESIALIYNDKYKVPVKVVRNLPFKADVSGTVVNRNQYKIPDGKKIFLFQGAGINVDRGAEESIDAISLVPGAVLLFIGGGDVIRQLHDRVTSSGMQDKVFFIPRQPLNELMKFTRMADFGLSLDKNTNLNYKYSLPNKLFDYIQARLPVLVTDLDEVKKIVLKYDIGLVTSSTNPRMLADKMMEMMRNEERFLQWKKNINLAAEELCWENEQGKLLELFQDAIQS